MANKIQYTDKDKAAQEGSPEKQWRDVDANEVKVSVNQIIDELDTKVTQVGSKQLSTFDYDSTAKSKVDNLPANTVDSLGGKQESNTRLTQLSALSITDKGNRSLKVSDTETGIEYEFAIPSLSDASRDALINADEGYIIFNTDESKLQRYNGSTWEEIGSGTTVTVAPNTGINSNNGELSTIYNTSIGDTVVSNAVGGASAQPASIWKTRTIVQALDTILFPTINPSLISNPSVSLSVNSSSGNIEVGRVIARTLTASYARGSVRNGDGTTSPNPLKGLATQYTFSGTGISSTSQAGNTLAINNTVVLGPNNWVVTVAYDAGTGDYFDNKGNIVANQNRNAGTVTDSNSSPSITGVYPWYHLKSASPISNADMVTAIQNGTATKIVAPSSGTISFPYDHQGEYSAIAYVGNTKTKYFVTTLNSGDLSIIYNPAATLSVVSPDNYWTTNYKIHVSPSPLTSANTSQTLEIRN